MELVPTITQTPILKGVFMSSALHRSKNPMLHTFICWTANYFPSFRFLTFSLRIALIKGRQIRWSGKYEPRHSSEALFPLFCLTSSPTTSPSSTHMRTHAYTRTNTDTHALTHTHARTHAHTHFFFQKASKKKNLNI